MADHTRHQKKIIERYYDRRDDIMLAKLGELVSELYVTSDARKLDRLWQRVEAAMKNLKVKPTLAQHILEKRSAEVLADHVKDWSGPA